MPCYHPMQVWPGEGTTVNGKRKLVFDKRKTRYPEEPQDIACGQCIGCRLERSRQWATRCLHEASLYEDNCFLTLTFSNEGLALREKQYIKKNKVLTDKGKEPKDVPSELSIHTPDLQLFMKRLRKAYGQNIRFFACGEYGEKCYYCEQNKKNCMKSCRLWKPTIGRPHYHLCLFNFNFQDKQQISQTDQGHKVYISDALSKLWPYGQHTIGQVTFDSAAYVARYIVKKVNGPPQEKHYQIFNKETWELTNIKPEFTTMSRRPGLGFKWFEKYNQEVYENDYIVINGKKIPAPKYYDNQLEQMDQFHYDEIRDKRLNNTDRQNIDNTPERLAIREKVKKKRIKQLTREV